MATLPTLNETDVKKANKQKLLKQNQWMAFIVTGAKASIVEDKGHFQIQITYAPMTDPEDPSSRTGPLMYDRLLLPVTNHDWTNDAGDKHEAPETFGLVNRTLTALFGQEGDEDVEDGIPAMPRRKGNAYVYKGQAIPKDSFEEAKDEVTSAVIQRAIDLYMSILEGENPLENHMVVGKIKHNKSGDRVFQNWEDLQPNLPDNVTLVTDPKEFKHDG